MCNMQTQRFHHGTSLFKVDDVIPIHIRCEKHVLCSQLHDLVTGFFNGICRISIFQGGRNRKKGFLLDLLCIYKKRLCQGDQVIYHIIHHMHRTTVYIENNVISIVFILMYHKNIPPRKKCKQRTFAAYTLKSFHNPNQADYLIFSQL